MVWQHISLQSSQKVCNVIEVIFITFGTHCIQKMWQQQLNMQISKDIQYQVISKERMPLLSPKNGKMS